MVLLSHAHAFARAAIFLEAERQRRARGAV